MPPTLHLKKNSRKSTNKKFGPKHKFKNISNHCFHPLFQEKSHFWHNFGAVATHHGNGSVRKTPQISKTEGKAGMVEKKDSASKKNAVFYMKIQSIAQKSIYILLKIVNAF